MSVNELFEWISLVASIVIIVGWIVVFKRFWPTMIIHMGPVYTYLIPVTILSGTMLRIIRALTFLGYIEELWWYIMFGVWVTASIAVIAMFLFWRKG